MKTCKIPYNFIYLSIGRGRQIPSRRTPRTQHQRRQELLRLERRISLIAGCAMTHFQPLNVKTTPRRTSSFVQLAGH